MKPDFPTFLSAAAQADMVPVFDTVMADLLTPVSAFLKIRGKGRNACLLESVEGGEKVARYSFVVFDPVWKIETKNGAIATHHFGGRAEPATDGTFWQRLEQEMDRSRGFHFDELPPFSGGGVGFFSYDLVRTLERIPVHPHDDLDLPDACIALYPSVLAFDHLKHRIVIIENVPVRSKSRPELEEAYQAACARIRRIEDRLQEPLDAAARLDLPEQAETQFRPMTRREDFLRAVARAKEYIACGDAFQIVLSQRFDCPFDGDAFDIYRALRCVNPSPYMFYLDLDSLQVVGASPEMLVKAQQGRLEYRPIAGTRRRGATDAEDARLIEDLKQDAKERAEHVMLVDLGRNDLGRVSEFGTVRVEGLMFIEKYSHVVHLVSALTGKLKAGLTRLDALRACFPAGTVTGAPKIRAMEIINELEPSQRGIYAGAIAYLDFAGNLDSCIAIRTVVVRRGTAHVQAGAGIVADSVPESEHQECLNKAGAMLKAIGLVQKPRRSAEPVS